MDVHLYSKLDSLQVSMSFWVVTSGSPYRHGTPSRVYQPLPSRSQTKNLLVAVKQEGRATTKKASQQKKKKRATLKFRGVGTTFSNRAYGRGSNLHIARHQELAL
jgi:hypothetical protein